MNVDKTHWIVTGKRFALNPIEWKIMKDIPPVECEKLVIQKDDKGNEIKFAGQRWDSRAQELKNVPIIEGQAMQGSMWCMSRKHWDEVIGKLQIEGYGPHYQDSHEMIFKTWKVGGKLMVNKDMWYAHKHRSFSRTHQEGTKENPSNRESSWAYALSVWKDYYLNEIVPKWKV